MFFVPHNFSSKTINAYFQQLTEILKVPSDCLILLPKTCPGPSSTVQKREMLNKKPPLRTRLRIATVGF
jgi:hypothetical protein